METRITPSVLIQERIQTAMEAQNISQARLASLIGVSAPRISQLLSPESNLTIKTVERLEEALDVELIR